MSFPTSPTGGMTVLDYSPSGSGYVDISNPANVAPVATQPGPMVGPGLPLGFPFPTRSGPYTIPTAGDLAVSSVGGAGLIGGGLPNYGTQFPSGPPLPPSPYVNDSPIGAMGGQQVPTANPFAPGGSSTLLNTPGIANPYQTSGLPINEMAIAPQLYADPAYAIDFTGAAQVGTPGYYNLANIGVDSDGMQALFLAIMGHAPTSPAEYLNFLDTFYTTLGTVGSQGGGTLNAQAVMGSLVNADPSSQLGQMIAADPSAFYSIASDALAASGAPPIATQGLQSQMLTLYQEYFNYAATSNANQTQPFNQWLQATHPDVVAAWTMGG